MINQTSLKINALQFDCLTAGNPSNELVIFLHGFPETAYMWRNILPSISKLGFFCIAPNMRGYSKEACPKGRKHYSLERLCEDIKTFAQYFGREKFHLIGHDWGAIIGWQFVGDHPKTVISWTALSVPHGEAMLSALRKNFSQIKKSWYVFFFQLPLLPELLIRRKDFQLLRDLWESSEEEEIEAYLSVFGNKKCLTAAINYYRNLPKKMIQSMSQTQMEQIKVPTLFIWGKTDLAIGQAPAEACHQYVEREYEFLKLEGGHWLIQSNYQEVKSAIERHLLRNRLDSKSA
jgi:pimeloyl-ACP methyl ester carboxylesterase